MNHNTYTRVSDRDGSRSRPFARRRSIAPASNRAIAPRAFDASPDRRVVNDREHVPRRSRRAANRTPRDRDANHRIARFQSTMSWTPSERAIVRATNRAASTASIAGASFVLLAGAVAPRTVRGKTYAYVKRLALSDLMFSTACALGDRGARGGAICALQGALIQTFGVAGAVWAALVSRALMESLRAGRARGDARREDGFAWTACAASALAPMLANAYGDSRLGRCHVKSEGRRAAIIRLVFYYVPIWAAFCYNARCWRAIRRGMASAAALEATLGRDDATARRAHARLRTYVRRLAWYPIAQVVTNVPGTALRASTLAGRAKPALWLACAHVACKTSQGAVHAIVFVLAHPARGEMAVELATAFGCARLSARARGVGAEDAQTGLGDLADDVDFASDDDEGDDEGGARAAGDGFVVLTRATMDDDDDDDDDAYASPTRTAAVEMSAFIGAREKRSDDASS